MRHPVVPCTGTNPNDRQRRLVLPQFFVVMSAFGTGFKFSCTCRRVSRRSTEGIVPFDTFVTCMGILLFWHPKTLICPQLLPLKQASYVIMYISSDSRRRA